MCRATDDTSHGDGATAGTASGLWRLAMCTAGICVCYLYYGVLQERLFGSDGSSALGATFVLVTQCVTNCLVAIVWQHVSDAMQQSDSTSTKEEDVTTSRRSAENDGTTSTRRRRQLVVLPLRHGLLLVTAGAYVGAMSCSNEAIRFVSYPVMVLAKSCKLIPTMLVGQLLENRMYTKQEWRAALLISAGILVFHGNRLLQQQQQENKPTALSSEGNNNDADATYGMMLLVMSLSLDGILASCQNFIKRPRTDARVPTAVETMLWINFYALIYLVPLSMYYSQWQTGCDTLRSSLFPSNNDTELIGDADDVDSSLAWKLLLINATTAAGQIFIFLTITWYTPVITTTITTTRKFVTILLSVWMYGHCFSAVQWMAVALVFSGLYWAILGVQRTKSSSQQQKKHGAAPLKEAMSTTSTTTSSIATASNNDKHKTE